MLTVGSVFSGIGGFDLGLERAGMRVIWQSEIDPYASAVLRHHWPTVPNLGDVRGIRWDKGWLVADAALGECRARLREVGAIKNWVKPSDSLRVDVLCGGFPCQDISNAGKRAGIDGERSGLWAEFARIIGELRPRYVIVENVAALLGRGIERVLGDLAALGFDAEWHCIPASAVGAPHRRDRIWIIAYANGQRRRGGVEPRADMERDLREPAQLRDGEGQTKPEVADPDEPRLEGRLRASLRECADQRTSRARGPCGWDEQQWFAESGMGRVAHGIPARVDRLRCLGNAIVPQIAEIIGRAIVEAESERQR